MFAVLFDVVFIYKSGYKEEVMIHFYTVRCYQMCIFIFADICGGKQREGHLPVQCNRCHVDSGPIQPNPAGCHLHLGSSPVLTLHHHYHFN
jgi:hypothetical protein